MQDVQLSPKFNARISADAKIALDASFETCVKHRSGIEHRSATQHQFTEALIRAAQRDERLASAPSQESPTLEHALSALRNEEKGTGQLLAPDSPTARALTMWPFRGDGDSALRIAHNIAGDAALQVLVPPYADKWTFTQQSGNAETRADADAQTGRFGFLDGAAGGSAACGAGVWVQFVPDGALPRCIEVRAYTPYNYQWDDASQMGYTAHNDAGFGIYVLSWDMQGNDRKLVQDHRYSVWSDGTGWWEEHNNPSWGNPDYGNAYLYGNEAPYFEAQPGRIYRACVWCFGTCDAGSGYFGNAVSAAEINATAGFVVIGEH